MSDDLSTGDDRSTEEKDDGALENWVFMEPRQRLTFDGRRINAHGTTHLSRSLESRKLVAVVGSGLSRSYGQPSWSALLKNTAAIVEKELANYKKPGHRPYPHLTSLIDRFEASELTTKLQKTEDVMINFELCDNLYSELHVHKLERANIEVRSRGDEVFKARAYLRARLKWQLRDDRGRIDILLSDREIIQELEAFTGVVAKAYKAAGDAYQDVHHPKSHAKAIAVYEAVLKVYEKVRDTDADLTKYGEALEIYDVVRKACVEARNAYENAIDDAEDVYAKARKALGDARSGLPQEVT